jgi:hypothetical protein
MQSRIDNLEKTFQSKMTLMERNNDALQKELAALRQEKLQQDEENKQLRGELTKLKVETEDNTNNDLNYNSSDNDSDDNDGDDNTDATNVGVMQGSDGDLQKEFASLKKKELEQHEENQRLKERLSIMKEVMQNNADNDLNYDSSDNERNERNESNDSSATNNLGVKKKDDYVLQKERAALKQKELEQHEENLLLKERLARIIAVQDGPHNDNKDYDKKNTTTNTQQRESHYHSVEIYADPNYMIRLTMKILGITITWIERCCNNETINEYKIFIPLPLLQIKELFIFHW